MVVSKLLLRGRVELRCRSFQGSTAAALSRTRAFGSKSGASATCCLPPSVFDWLGQPNVLYSWTRRTKTIDLCCSPVDLG